MGGDPVEATIEPVIVDPRSEATAFIDELSGGSISKCRVRLPAREVALQILAGRDVDVNGYSKSDEISLWGPKIAFRSDCRGWVESGGPRSYATALDQMIACCAVDVIEGMGRRVEFQQQQLVHIVAPDFRVNLSHGEYELGRVPHILGERVEGQGVGQPDRTVRLLAHSFQVGVAIVTGAYPKAQ